MKLIGGLVAAGAAIVAGLALTLRSAPNATLGRSATSRERRLLSRGVRTWRKPRLPGGIPEREHLHPRMFDRDQLAIGVGVEMEHTRDPTLATEIAMAHLAEDRRYYVKLERMERT